MKQLTYIFTILAAVTCHAQDVHFSQVSAVPLTTNPALTGVFNGDYRIGINYRDQWSTISKFETISFFADASLFKRQMKGDFVGVGLMFYNDGANDASGAKRVNTLTAQFSASFLKRLTNKPAQYLSIGTQIGYMQRTITPEGLTYGTLWEEGNNYDPLVDGNSITGSHMDLTTGLFWYTYFNKHADAYAGMSLSHITRPKLSFLFDERDRLNRKFTIHGGGRLQLSETFSLLPSTQFGFQGPSFEGLLGGWFRYQIETMEKNNFGIYAGPWFRLVGNMDQPVSSDAIIIAFRLDFFNFALGVSFDINISDLNTISNGNGGPEISLIYIGGAGNPGGPSLGSKINCPKF